jgi:hypothetical protein
MVIQARYVASLIILVDKMHSLVSWLAGTSENYGMNNELNNS